MLGVGVFDGHSGQEASKYVAENMWNQVIATTEWGQGDIDGALKAAFLAVDANMQRDKVCHGTTAVVAVVTPEYLYVANCGDSRAVLCKEGVSTAMSTDHKPCVYTEMSRVIRCGGQQVIPGEFGGVARVTAPGSMVAMATSRSLGDFHFKRNYNADQSEQVVSPAAEVVCVRRTLGDEFLILGTDGVWDVLSNQEVSDMMRASNRTRIPRVPAPRPPPSVIWENSSSQASAAAAAAAAAAVAENSRRDAADGGGRAGKASREPGAPQSLGATTSQKAAGDSNDTPAGATNGFLPTAVPTTPHHPPVTPHNLQQTTPFGARAAASASAAAAAGAGTDPYDSSDFGSSDGGDGAVDPSQVGMSIDEESGGGDRRPGDYFLASSAATGSKRPPAFIRLITPTLLRLVTPTPPNPANGPPRAAAAPASEATAAKKGVAGGGKGRNSPPPVAVGDGACAEDKPGSDSGKGGDSVGNGPSVAGQGGSSGVMTELVCAYAGETGAESESAAPATMGSETPAAAAPAAPASEASASEISAAAATATAAAGASGANSSSPAEGTELTSVAGARPPASNDKPVCLAVGVDEAGVLPGRTCSSEASKVYSGKEAVHAGAAQSAPHSNESAAGEKKRDSTLRLPVGEPGSLSSSSSSSSIAAGEALPSDAGPPGKDGTVGEELARKQGVAGDKDKVGGGVPDGGGGGSWSTTPPPRPPGSLPRHGGGEGASTRASATAPEASGVGSSSSSIKSVVDDSASAPAAPAASVATNPAASGHNDDGDHGGTTSRARTPGAGASSEVTPNPGGRRASGSSDGGGITPSARTPGASSGGGGVSTAGTTPASGRTPGGGAFSIGGSSSGGGGGTWTSGGVGQTPSRRPSTSRGTTPSRVNSYRRSSGSGINLGLFKGPSSLSVSLSGQGDRSAIGAVQGVLDQALLKGSQ
ncbi:unnamed protein product, partial [Ectocarpus sp. 13 AM-2016]